MNTDILLVSLAAVAVTASFAMAVRVVAMRWRGQPLVLAHPWEPVAWDGPDVAAVFLMQVAFQLVAVASGPKPMPIAQQLAAGAASTVAATFVAVWILRSRGASWRSLGLETRSFGRDAKLALAVLALVLAPLLILSSGLDQLVPYRHPIIDFLATHRDALSLAVVFLSAVVVAPIAEEFFFRRVLQGWLQKRLPQWGGMGAIAIASLAFGLAHVGQGLAWMPLVLFGMAVGYLAKQTGSIVPGIIVHSLFNAVSVGLVLLQTSQTPLEIDLVAGEWFRHNPATLQCHVAEPRSASQESFQCHAHSLSSVKTESLMGRCGL